MDRLNQVIENHLRCYFTKEVNKDELRKDILNLFDVIKREQNIEIDIKEALKFGTWKGFGDAFDVL